MANVTRAVARRKDALARSREALLGGRGGGGVQGLHGEASLPEIDSRMAVLGDLAHALAQQPAAESAAHTLRESLRHTGRRLDAEATWPRPNHVARFLLSWCRLRRG